ncbi:hypothetical protein [Vallitalea guaymasensis]|uniref:hypothetical protein n=1 Tax=Vallitalea guaymasensis TaxID=1185412 RepID=UPI000DE2166B|nr:hypothetical protein [Vallitalea guaymasensis]
MRKLKISFILIFSMLVLSSCSLVDIRLKMLNAVDEEAIANARLEEVIEVLGNQDKDALKVLFSEQALDESIYR